MNKITKYFRNAVLSASQCQINYKNDPFAILSLSEIENGQITSADIKFLWKSQSKNEKNIQQKNKYPQSVIIALKTISSEFLNGNKTKNNLDEMTSIFFLPAIVTYEGTLSIPENKFPWIPREFLQPMLEEQLALGTCADYDKFLEQSTAKRNLLDSWGDYFDYAKELYEEVTKSKFSEEILPNQKIKTDGKFYIFKDPIVNATYHIINLYNNLLSTPILPLLYSKLTNGLPEPNRIIANILDPKKMTYHAGQMGGEYPLSPSQREAINCFEEIENGEVLAVNGPPGTGKTTLLQTIVANMYVRAALNEDRAPIIVATSTNNQAVTNIIDSFGQINPIGIKNLECRWITGVNSFSLYFPSTQKMNNESTSHYQCTNINNNIFEKSIESSENREKSKHLFENEFLKYFNKKTISLDVSVQHIHDELKSIDCQRLSCIAELKKVKDIIGNENCFNYLNRIKQEIEKNDQEINVLLTKIMQQKTHGNILKNRRIQWRQSYTALPWYVKTLQFLPFFKKKLKAWSYDNMTYDELNFLQRGMTIDEIEEKYYNFIAENDTTINQMQNKKNAIQEANKLLLEQYNSLEILLNKIKDMLLSFAKYQIIVNENDFITSFDVEKINNLLDKLRYIEFWLAVHYYEGRWLNENNPAEENQNKTTSTATLDIIYHRLAMLTPCMVMTCFMLPKQFLTYDNNAKKSYHLYNFIDLLIVDEAGQISPEIGLPAFALAKKAVVVGDEQQIPPVWGNQRALDITMAIANHVIPDKESFLKLEANGLNCSQSSIMKIASLSCPFEKYGKGLFLSEHRRCYNEIVTYCNNLVYNGKLEPLRGYAKDDKNNVLSKILPPMGHKQINSAASQKDGSSRINTKEANVIVDWLEKNYPIIIAKYKDLAIKKDEEFNEKNIIGVITPFKKQSHVIKQLIKTRLPLIKDNISVGTVHTFQGAERKVILFSTVYGNQDGCYFINNNKSLMNVAVSRAKDSFLVFGDSGCLIGNNKSPAVMLKQATLEEID